MDHRLEHHVIWHCSRLASSEHASLLEHQDGYRSRGIVVLPREGIPCHIDYEVVPDAHWSARAGIATVTTPTQVRRIELRSKGAGQWELDGTSAPQLDGCGEIDLGWTPATNTGPIRRLGLEVGQTASITAAWVRFPELDVVASEQRYTRLAHDRWRYQSGNYDFELVTDEATGLVVTYGNDLWRAAAIVLGRSSP
jgi:hypothetical protein